MAIFEDYSDRNNRLYEWKSLFAAANISDRPDVDAMRYAKMHIDWYSAKTDVERKKCEFEIVSYWIDKLKYRPRLEQAIGLKNITEDRLESWDSTVREMLDHISKPVSVTEERTDV